MYGYTEAQARRLADKLCKRLGPDWVPHVWNVTPLSSVNINDRGWRYSARAAGWSVVQLDWVQKFYVRVYIDSAPGFLGSSMELAEYSSSPNAAIRKLWKRMSEIMLEILNNRPVMSRASKEISFGK